MQTYQATLLRSSVMRRQCVAILLLLFAMSKGSAATDNPVRLGWQLPWATQGQLVMGFKHTNIPELVDLPLKYIDFAYGGPLNKAALAGEVDILLTADQPALVLMARDSGYRIVSRLMYNRVCIYVPPESPVVDLSDLAGKAVMGPVGAAAERVAMAGIAAAGVDTSTMRSGKLDMAQQSAMLAGFSDEQHWPNIDAMYGFDPLPAVFEEQGKVRMLHCDKVVSVVVASREMVEDRKEDLAAFLRGFVLSWLNFNANPEEMNRIFSAESRLNVSQKVLDDAASIEPNRWAEGLQDMSFEFSGEDYGIFGVTNDFLIERGIVELPVNVREHMDLSVLRQVLDDDSLGDLFSSVRPR